MWFALCWLQPLNVARLLSVANLKGIVFFPDLFPLSRTTVKFGKDQAE